MNVMVANVFRLENGYHHHMTGVETTGTLLEHLQQSEKNSVPLIFNWFLMCSGWIWEEQAEAS